MLFRSRASIFRVNSTVSDICNGYMGIRLSIEGDKVETSYRGLIDFDEEHPNEAVKIVVITVDQIFRNPIASGNGIPVVLD